MLTYPQIRKQILPAIALENEVYEKVRDMISLCEALEMNPNECREIVHELLKSLPLELVKEVNIYVQKTKEHGRVFEGDFYIACKELTKNCN